MMSDYFIHIPVYSKAPTYSSFNDLTEYYNITIIIITLLLLFLCPKV